MTEYTDQDLRDAFMAASRERDGLSINGWAEEEYWSQEEVDALRAILKHLPRCTKDGEWQEVAENRIRKGDTVRWVREMADGSTLTVEGVADYRSDAFGELDGWYSIEGVRLTPIGNNPAGVNVAREKLYRVPRKQAPPDPREHRLIIDGNGTLYQSSGGRYMTPGPFGTVIESRPEAFTDWAPAKVILDEDS